MEHQRQRSIWRQKDSVRLHMHESGSCYNVLSVPGLLAAVGYGTVVRRVVSLNDGAACLSPPFPESTAMALLQLGTRQKPLSYTPSVRDEMSRFGI